MIASLREQGQRNTPLLRTLSYNIVKYNMKLNINQCSTLLYSMAVLNFPDKVIFLYIFTHICEYISILCDINYLYVVLIMMMNIY